MWSLCTARSSFVSLRVASTTRYLKTDATIAELEAEPALLEEDLQQKEMEIEKKRNKSRLSEKHFNMIHDRVPYSTPMHWAHLTTKYNRKLFGTLGFASNVDPRICWMDKTALQEAIEYENIKYDQTVLEVLNKAKIKANQEKEEIMLRQNTIIAKLAKLNQWQKDMEERNNKKLKDAHNAKEKKDRLVEEVRRHFGFKIDPRDERFQEMLAQKEKAQKKADKLKRQNEKEAQMIAKLQQKNTELSQT